jgi:alkanesulfonate monooxygenase SsuD/methylene tetrahydromethanopterin reductase-like flavin-dependent oxidoreductase (luciferase family)
LRSWDSAAAASGTPTQDVTKPIMINCVVADTDEEATRLAQEYIPRFMQAQLDHYTPDEVDWEKMDSYRAWRGQFAGMKAKTDPANIPAWAEFQLVGSPDTVASKTARYIEAGFNHIFVHAATPGVPRDVRRQWTERFAREVAPRFTARVPHAGAVA